MANKRYMSEKNEFIERVLKEVNEIPLDEIIGKVVKLYPRGKHMMGLCPFHPDHNLGSFVVTPSKNLWRCFSEGIGGNGIKFEMEYYNLRFLDAVFKLALDFGIVTQGEFERYSRKRYDDVVVERLQNMVEAPRTVEHIIASKRVIHNVYSAMLREFPLTEEHRRHLLDVRKLSEEDLKNYFSFPSRRVNVPERVVNSIKNGIANAKFQKKYASCSDDEKLKVNESLERSKLVEELRYVPGFFYDKEHKKIDFVSYSGIGVCAKDVEGNILGIQIRRDKIRKGDSRYIWFSSSFAQDNELYEGGASPGSPAGIIFPKKDGPKRICITEGRFKAEKIADTGNIAIFVSGVSTWRPVLSLLDSLDASMSDAPVYLMYDADIFGNIAVYKQLKAFAFELSKRGRKTFVIMWNESLGKGFDDLYINNEDYAKHLRMKSFNEFERGYDETLNRVLRDFGAENIRDITADEAQSFCECLQNGMSETFNLA